MDRAAGRRALRATALASLLVGLGGALSVGHAQTPRPAVVDGVLATPVEIVMTTTDSQVRCRPPRARLPARVPLDMRVINRAQAPLLFVAPEFLAAARDIEFEGFVEDVIQGGFRVAPESTARIVLRAPEPGEYYYSCFAPGNAPNPASSGFFVVLPPANRPVVDGGQRQVE